MIDETDLKQIATEHDLIFYFSARLKSTRQDWIFLYTRDKHLLAEFKTFEQALNWFPKLKGTL